MKNWTKRMSSGISFLVILGTLGTISACSNELSSKTVEKDIAKARKATEKAQERAETAVNSRKQLYEQTKQERIDKLQSRISQIDDRLASLGDISSNSSNTGAVSNVNAAIYEFKNEKDSLQGRVNQFNAVQSPNWNAAIKGINSSVDRIESELNMLEKTLK